MRPRCSALIGWVLVSNVALTDSRNYVFSTHPNILYNRFTFRKQPTVDSYARYITALHPSLYESSTNLTVLKTSISLLQSLAMKAPLGILQYIVSLGTPTNSGCGKPLPEHFLPGGSYKAQINTTDGLRDYIIHIPCSYDENSAVPLIFSFHARDKNAEYQEQLSQFSNVAWNPDSIAVYPQGIDVRVSNSPYLLKMWLLIYEHIQNQWQGDPDSHGVDDVEFTMTMLDHFEDRYCIDSSRVYATGKSNGGGFTNLLACDATASTRIAAFAPVSGAFYQDVAPVDCNPETVPIECNPGRDVIPIIEFHGSADPVIPYDGGGRRGECLPSLPHFIQEWANRDGLGEQNQTTSLYNGSVLEYQYGLGTDLGTVTHYWIEGLGHAWPSTDPNCDNLNGTYLNATPMIMDFFSRWTLP
jgi:poly(3-hydroxybutyrate) depolymerase